MSSKRVYRLTFVAIVFLAVLLALNWLERSAYKSTTDGFYWVTHTQSVQRELHLLMSGMKDLEAGGRGYLLSQSAVYLEPLTIAQRDIPLHQRELHHLISDNPSQVGRMAVFDAIIAEKLVISSEMVSLQQKGNHEQAMQLFSSHRGRVIMDKARKMSDEMDGVEERLLEERQQKLASSLSRREIFSLILVAVSVALAALLGILFLRLQRAKDFITICAWSKSIEYQGEWIPFEEYLKRRFHIEISHGVSPEEFERIVKAEGISESKNGGKSQKAVS